MSAVPAPTLGTVAPRLAGASGQAASRVSAAATAPIVWAPM